MNQQSLIEQIKALPAGDIIRQGDKALSAQNKALIASAYLSIMGKTVRECSCKSRYTDALTEILLHLNHLRIMANNYELKAGKLIWLNNDPYSNSNLTDDIAREWCAQHPELVEIYFQRWENESPKETTATTAPANKPKAKPKKKA